MSIGLISDKRLRNIPKELRLSHEYCFFLHDQCVQIFKEYEEADAHFVEIKFKNRNEAKILKNLSKKNDPITALRDAGYFKDAQRVIINQIILAMTSDCIHHIFEALKCLEKRKSIVALNLLRKPLKDNLLYLSWILGDEDNFYQEFITGNPERLTQARLGNIRTTIFLKAIAATSLNTMNASLINSILFDRKNDQGLEILFQHAVHLITVQHLEVRTSAENFNFIFNNPAHDDIYHQVYNFLPYILLFLSHIVVGLFNKIKKLDESAYNAFYIRSTGGLALVEGIDIEEIKKLIDEMLPQKIICQSCRAKPRINLNNACRILMSDSFRCSSCRKISDFPFSWLIT